LQKPKSANGSGLPERRNTNGRISAPVNVGHDVIGHTKGETAMLSRFAAIFSLTLLVLSFSSISQAEGRQCSATLEAGDWAFTYSGTVITPAGPVPVASGGRFTAKADGTFTGKETASVGGQVADETLSGTFSVNADCTAVYIASVFLDGTLVRTSTLNIVYDNNGRSARGIFASLVLPDGTTLPTVITIDAAKIFP
jgi:hypothetical protein